jgi:hypothetical protein
VCVKGINSDAWYYYTSSLFRAKDATREIKNDARGISQVGGTAKTKRCPSPTGGGCLFSKNPKHLIN